MPIDAQKEELDQLRRRIVSHVEYEAKLEASLGELEGRIEALEQKLGSMSHWADTVVPGLAESVASLQESVDTMVKSVSDVNDLVDAKANTLFESIWKLEDACNREFAYLERGMEQLRGEGRMPPYMDSTSDDMVALGLTTHSGKRHVIE